MTFIHERATHTRLTSPHQEPLKAAPTVSRSMPNLYFVLARGCINLKA
jgi:hypothetical protein